MALDPDLEGSALIWKLGSGSGRIRISFGSWIRIRIRGKIWIWIRIPVKTQKLSGLKMEAWRAVDAWSQIPITLKRSWIRLRIK
jgi:hypothetical protein